jgi:multidrug efflux system membrane fusion protein
MPLQIRAVGNVEAYSTVAVKSQVTGVLTQAHFKEGQNVKKAQLLFTIDPRPFEATLKQAEANLARDTAQLQNSREQARRYAELVKKQYVSQEQYDQIRANGRGRKCQGSVKLLLHFFSHRRAGRQPAGERRQLGAG